MSSLKLGESRKLMDFENDPQESCKTSEKNEKILKKTLRNYRKKRLWSMPPSFFDA